MDFLEFDINGVKFHAHAFVDYFSTSAQVRVVRRRTAEVAASNLLWFLNITDPYVPGGVSKVRVKHDRAREFLAKHFATVAMYSGVVQFPLVPYEHEMNGLVERFNQTLQRMVVVVMHDSNMPMKFVVYAIEFCVHVYNRVPVQALEWLTRWQKMSGAAPDVRYIFRFGCLSRVLLPLELRKHKFHTYTEDCVYLGPCPLGKGTRFLRLKNQQVYVRDDCVVYADVMPFRSVGGQDSVVHFNAANDVMHSIAWDVDDATTSTDNAQNVHTPQLSPGSTVVLRSAPQPPASPLTMQNLDHVGSPASPAHSDSGYEPFETNHQIATSPASPVVAPSCDPRHGTLSTKTTRGEWKENHCSISSACTLPDGHDGLCSHLPAQVEFRGTRGARAGTARQFSLPAVVEEEQESSEHEDDASHEIEALLATASTGAQFLDGNSTGCTQHVNVSGPSLLNYQTAVDAFVASVSEGDIDGPVSDSGPKRKSSREKTFDMSLPIPKNLSEAMLSPNWDVPFGWKFAYSTEGGAFIKHRVMQDVDTVPDGVTVIPMGEVLTVKTDKHGRFKKAKLRFVVKAHSGIAKEGEHFFDNFSQTVKWPNLRKVLDFACERGFCVARSWDTSTAFLYQVLEPGTQVYVKLPNGLGQFCGVSGTIVKLLRNTYGLPSAPAGFEMYRTSVLTGDRCRMTQCKHDESVFIRSDGDRYIIICTWVDDYLVVSNDQALYDEVYKGYFHDVDGEDGPLDFMLGVNFDVDFEAQSIKIYSEKAIKRILQRFGTPLRSSPIPCVVESANLHEEPLPEPNSPEWWALRSSAERYRSLVPSMLYVGSTTRPDTVYTLSILCRCLDNPSKRHIEAADLLLSYLLGTIFLGVLYCKRGNGHLRVLYSGLKNQTYACSDSNWATGKSTSGYCIYGKCGLYSWGSKLQSVTAISSTEAEFYAGSVCAVEVLASRHFEADLDERVYLPPTPIFVDNSACVNLAKHFSSCRRVKHIDRRVYFLTDYQSQGEVEVLPIPTKDNTADLFTKPLPKPLFLKHRASVVV